MNYCVGVQLTECKSGESYYHLRRLDSGRVRGIMHGDGGASSTIASYSDKKAVKNHQDDPLIGLPFDTNKTKFSTRFVPEY